MSDTLSLMVNVRDGALALTTGQAEAVKNFLRGRTVPVSFRLSKRTDQRSLNQNRYYFGVILATISEFTGHDVNDLHCIYRDRYLPEKFITLGGREVSVRKTTTDLTPKEFSEYCERIIVEAGTELGVAIPEAVR